MSQPSQRAAMVPVQRAVRAYFAPVNRDTNTPAIFDPARHGAFDLDTPPSPWRDLGWIDHFDHLSLEDSDVVRSGAPSTPAVPFRRAHGVRLECDFREWGKLQMAVACGSQHLNVLASDPNTDLGPVGGTPVRALAVLPGSTATELIVGNVAIDLFQPGDLIAVDLDYQQQVGYVGTGIA